MSFVKIRKAMRWAVPLTLITLVLAHERQVLAAATVEWNGFEKVGTTYFAPSLSEAERASVRKATSEAQQRVSSFYGRLRAQPKLVVADASSYKRFASNTTGVAHYLPTGNALIVVGPLGQNVDVIAHELAHAELLARIGYRAISWCVPTWFDEGLAVQFDERPHYTESAYLDRVHEGWRFPPFTALENGSGFNGGTREQVRFHYAGARLAVGQWLNSMSHAAAISSIETWTVVLARSSGFNSWSTVSSFRSQLAERASRSGVMNRCALRKSLWAS